MYVDFSSWEKSGRFKQTAVTAERLKAQHRSRGIEIGDGNDSKPVMQNPTCKNQRINSLSAVSNQETWFLLPRGHQRFTKMNGQWKLCSLQEKNSEGGSSMCWAFQADICMRHFQDNSRVWNHWTYWTPLEKIHQVVSCLDLFRKGKPRDVLIGLTQNLLDLLQLEILKGTLVI